jgi:acetyl-CoA synthetase
MLQASNPSDMHWLMSRAGYKPVMEYCGGTEIGGAFIGGSMLHPCVPSAFATPTLGYELYVLPPDGSPPLSVEAPQASCIGLRGEVALLAPAVGSSQQLLNRDHHSVYFAGMPTVDSMPLRRHGDEFEVLPGYGYMKAHGRCDDTMNLGGIKVRGATTLCSPGICGISVRRLQPW